MALGQCAEGPTIASLPTPRAEIKVLCLFLEQETAKANVEKGLGNLIALLARYLIG